MSPPKDAYSEEGEPRNPESKLKIPKPLEISRLVFGCMDDGHLGQVEVFNRKGKVVCSTGKPSKKVFNVKEVRVPKDRFVVAVKINLVECYPMNIHFLIA